MDKAISASYCLSLAACMKQFGVDDFLAQFDFDSSFYCQADAYLSSEFAEKVIESALSLSDCAHLGLIVGQSFSISTHGFLGYAVMSSPDLATAIETMLTYLSIRTRILTVSLNQTDKDTPFIELKVHADNPRVQRFFVDMAFSHLVNMHDFLLSDPLSIKRIELSYGPLKERAIYHKVFRADVDFEQSYNRAYLPRDALSQPVMHADSMSFELAKQQLQQLVVGAPEHSDLPGQLKTLMLESELHSLTMETIAQELFMSSRTLRRHLEKHGSTFQKILDEVRQKKALAYLNDPNISITEISFLLGFKDSSNFSRAFKRWTGLSPSQYKRT